MPFVPGSVRYRGVFVGRPLSGWSFAKDPMGDLRFTSPSGSSGVITAHHKQVEGRYGAFEESGGLYLGHIGRAEVKVYIRDKPRSYMFENPEGLWVSCKEYKDGFQISSMISPVGPISGWAFIVFGSLGSLGEAIRWFRRRGSAQ